MNEFDQVKDVLKPIKVVSMTPVNENPEGVPVDADVLHLDELPGAMDKMGWKVSAQMMRRWFATRPAWAMPEGWRKGKSEGQDIDYTKLPPSQVDDQIIKMQWVLGFERMKPVFDGLLQVWHNPKGVEELRNKLDKAGWQPGQPEKTVRLGRDNMPAKELDLVSQVNYKEFGEVYDKFDDLFGAIFKATLKLAVVGKAYSSRESGKDIFEVERMGVYLRDTYDFNAGKFEEVFMGLGVWSRDRLLRLDEMTEFKLNVLAGLPGRIANHLRYPGFVPVRNIDFRHWQEKHNSGGDFFVFSDVLWMEPNVRYITL